MTNYKYLTCNHTSRLLKSTKTIAQNNPKNITTTKTQLSTTSKMIRDCERFEIIEALGRGKYSDVYKGVDGLTKKFVVIKILKPVRKVKISREICILQALRNGTNIVNLIDVCLDKSSNTPSLVFEYISPTILKNILTHLNLDEIKHYILEILKGMDYCHSRGIMHRDIKPMNIIIDEETKELKLIDWGLSEYYLPNKEFNTRVSSRPYKSPELLIGYNYYDFSMDIWSLGCILGSMIFKKDYLFLGKDNSEQMLKIVNVLGSNGFFEYLKKIDLKLSSSDTTYYKG